MTPVLPKEIIHKILSLSDLETCLNFGLSYDHPVIKSFPKKSNEEYIKEDKVHSLRYNLHQNNTPVVNILYLIFKYDAIKTFEWFASLQLKLTKRTLQQQNQTLMENGSIKIITMLYNIGHTFLLRDLYCAVRFKQLWVVKFLVINVFRYSLRTNSLIKVCSVADLELLHILRSFNCVFPRSAVNLAIIENNYNAALNLIHFGVLPTKHSCFKHVILNKNYNALYFCLNFPELFPIKMTDLTMVIKYGDVISFTAIFNLCKLNQITLLELCKKSLLHERYDITKVCSDALFSHSLFELPNEKCINSESWKKILQDKILSCIKLQESYKFYFLIRCCWVYFENVSVDITTDDFKREIIILAVMTNNGTTSILINLLINFPSLLNDVILLSLVYESKESLSELASYGVSLQPNHIEYLKKNNKTSLLLPFINLNLNNVREIL